jgi:hypothetical protein
MAGLQDLYNWLSGSQPAMGPQSGQTGTAPPTGLPGLLATPAAQGILGAYFNYLARPRGIGTSRLQGVGLAGEGGLQAYEAAQSQQMRLPLQQAQLQEALAGAKEKTAEASEKGQYYAAHPEAMGWKIAPDLQKSIAIKAANGTTAASLRATAGLPATTPSDRQRLLSTADMVEAATTYISPADALKAAYVDPALVEREVAERLHSLGTPRPDCLRLKA